MVRCSRRRSCDQLVNLQPRLRIEAGRGWACSDVRDLAAVHAALMTPGAGPRRYTCGGHFLSTGQAIALLEEATGYTIGRVPMPAGAMVALGGFSELVHRVAGRVTPFTHDAMVYLTRGSLR